MIIFIHDNVYVAAPIFLMILTILSWTYLYLHLNRKNISIPIIESADTITPLGNRFVNDAKKSNHFLKFSDIKHKSSKHITKKNTEVNYIDHSRWQIRSFFSNYKNKKKSFSAKNNAESLPFVSVIVPARNEEKKIERCLISLLNQNYPYFEIIALDDKSTDNTLKLMNAIMNNDNKTYNLSESQIKKLRVYPITDKPSQWTGKTWASEQGFLKSKGDILLFTDGDTYYSKRDIILQTVLFMKKDHLDVLTGIPTAEKLDNFWSKITMPMWDVINILFGVNSPDVNDPKSKIAFLIGSFFLIKRKVLIDIGTFDSVHEDIQEDKALGIIIKRKNYKMKLVKLKEMVYTIWAEDLLTLWNGIGRTVSPLVIKNKLRITINLLVIFFGCLLPFILFSVCLITIIHLSLLEPFANINFFLKMSSLFLIFNLMMCISISINYLREGKISGITLLNLIAVPFSSCFVFAACLYHILPLLVRGNTKPILWQGRQYIYDKEQQGFGI